MFTLKIHTENEATKKVHHIANLLQDIAFNLEYLQESVYVKKLEHKIFDQNGNEVGFYSFNLKDDDNDNDNGNS